MVGDHAYHRLAYDKRKRVLFEPLIVAALFLIAAGVTFGIVFGVSGADDLDELDRVTSIAIMLGSLALLIPITLLAAHWMRRDRGQLSSITGRLRWRWLGQCVLLAVGTNVVSIVGYGLIAHVAGWDSASSDPTHWVGWAEFLPLAVVLIMLVPLQAAGEEYLVRGTLVQAVGAWSRSIWPPIIVSSIVFALIHLTAFDTSIFIFLMGAITAWLTIRTGGLEAAIAEHAVNNVVIFLAIAALQPGLFDQDDLNAGSEPGAMIAQSIGLIAYAVLVTRRHERVQ